MFTLRLHTPDSTGVVKLAVKMFVLMCLSGCNGCPDKQHGGGDHLKVISMVPSATEIIYDMGMGHSLIGVCDQCNYPVDASRLPHLGSYLNPNVEEILKLKPNLVFIYETQGRLAGLLSSAGIRYKKVRTENLSDLYSAIEGIGRALNKPRSAGILVSRIRMKIESVRKLTLRFGRRKKVAIVIDRMKDSLRGIFSASDHSYIGELVDIAGGDNCFKWRDVGKNYPMVSLESIAVCKPEVLIDVRPAGELRGDGMERIRRMWFSSGIVFPNGFVKRVSLLPATPVTIPGPRITESIEMIFNAIWEGKGQ